MKCKKCNRTKKNCKQCSLQGGFLPLAALIPMALSAVSSAPAIISGISKLVGKGKGQETAKKIMFDEYERCMRKSGGILTGGELTGGELTGGDFFEWLGNKIIKIRKLHSQKNGGVYSSSYPYRDVFTSFRGSMPETSSKTSRGGVVVGGELEGGELVGKRGGIKTGGKKPRKQSAGQKAWIAKVKAYSKKHGCTYKEALSRCGK